MVQRARGGERSCDPVCGLTTIDTHTREAAEDFVGELRWHQENTPPVDKGLELRRQATGVRMAQCPAVQSILDEFGGQSPHNGEVAAVIQLRGGPELDNIEMSN